MSLPQPTIDMATKVVVKALKATFRKGGSLTATGLTEGVDAGVRLLTRRASESAVAAPRPVADQQSLARSLSERPDTPTMGNAGSTAVAAKIAQRFGRPRFLARRTPIWLLAVGGPALYESVTRGADEVGMLASHLVLRTREAGMDPDPERIRRAAVQLASGTAVDTGTDARHGPLVLSWVTRAARATIPFGAGVTTRDPAKLAAAAARVPVAVVAKSHEVA